MLDKIGNRIAAMRAFIIESCRKVAGFGVAFPVGKLGFEDAGSAGAQENADTFAPITYTSGFNRFREVVLLQSKLREAVIAAIVGCESGAHRVFFEAIDASDVCVQINIKEITARKT